MGAKLEAAPLPSIPPCRGVGRWRTRLGNWGSTLGAFGWNNVRALSGRLPNLLFGDASSSSAAMGMTRKKKEAIPEDAKSGLFSESYRLAIYRQRRIHL